MASLARPEWPPVHVRLLVALWATARTAKQIGHTLGYSRNAVIGKANRMQLAPKKPKPEPVRRFADLKAGECRFIEGEPRGNPVVCGKPAVEGRPYCEEHMDRCVVGWRKS